MYPIAFVALSLMKSPSASSNSPALVARPSPAMATSTSMKYLIRALKAWRPSPSYPIHLLTTPLALGPYTVGPYNQQSRSSRRCCASWSRRACSLRGVGAGRSGGSVDAELLPLLSESEASLSESLRTAEEWQVPPPRRPEDLAAQRLL